jgi:hypothetical protein
MILLIYYVVLVLLGDFVAVVLCLGIERVWPSDKPSDVLGLVSGNSLGGLALGCPPDRTEGEDCARRRGNAGPTASIIGL